MLEKIRYFLLKPQKRAKKLSVSMNSYTTMFCILNQHFTARLPKRSLRNLLRGNKYAIYLRIIIMYTNLQNVLLQFVVIS